MAINSKIRPVLALLLLVLLTACDKYTAPSPIDGAWRMVEIKNNSEETIPIPDGATPYWDFSNVIYAVGYQPKGALSIYRMGYGYALFDRDVITLKANEGIPHYFPVPSTDKLTEIQFKYKVWNGKLRLIAPTYTIYLERK